MQIRTFILNAILILFSCSQGNRETIVDRKHLTARDFRVFQNTPAWELAKAVENQNEQKIEEIILKSPQLIDFRDPEFGNTLLMLTVMNQKYKAFCCLIANKADVNVHNSFDGTSPLIEAVRLRGYDKKFVEKLIASGANVNDIQTGTKQSETSLRMTPLTAAVGSGKLENVELLLKHGADVNLQNELAESALSKAMMLSNYQMVFFLLNKGADYRKPIFYRPDYSVPTEKQDSQEFGRPVYILEMLRESFVDFDTQEYQFKMRIVEFLKMRGLNYRSMPVPEYVKRKVQEKYPSEWERILTEY